MSHTFVVAGALVACLAFHTLPASAQCEDYPEDLRVMVNADQALRSRWEMSGPTPGSDTPRIVQLTEVVDRQNTARLKSLIKRCGWPKRSVHGRDAVNDAWLLAQHADRDFPFQKEVVTLLQHRVAEGEAPGDHLAYLSDRVAIAEGKPQLYGTQLDVKGECELEFFALDDRAKVEERRTAIGWPSLEEYKQLVINNALPEKCRSQSPPK